VPRPAGLLAALTALAALAAFTAGAETRILFHGSTGLGLDGLTGYLGEQDRQERIVVETDEAPVHLLFFWDSKGLEPWVTVTDARGRRVGEQSLARGNRLTLGMPGRYVLMLSARRGTGHWFCVLLSGRQWDTGR
jgi:hypothetical protein